MTTENEYKPCSGWGPLPIALILILFGAATVIFLIGIPILLAGIIMLFGFIAVAPFNSEHSTAHSDAVDKTFSQIFLGLGAD